MITIRASRRTRAPARPGTAVRLLALLPLFFPPLLAADDAARTDHVTVRLIPEARVAAPGERVTVAFHQSIIPGWHTYWKNPGDSGEPVQLTWRLPDGAGAGPIQWPAPEAIPFGPLVNFGYSGEVSFLTDLALPAAWPAGEPLPLRVEAYWLVCEEACIPESATLELALPTGPRTRRDPDVAGLFAAARAAQARSLATAAEFVVDDGAVLLSLPLADLPLDAVDDVRFFPDAWGRIEHAAPQAATTAGDLLSLRMAAGQAPPGEALTGVLRVTGTRNGAPARLAFTVEARRAGAAPPGASAGAGPAPRIWLVLLAALAGGMVLNLMPCVFPVLALKAFALVSHAGESRRRQLTGGLAYAGGVVASFLLLAAALQAVKAGGAAVGWGFHLQQPLVVTVLAFVMFAVGLNLSGVYSVGEGLAGVDPAAARRRDWVGSALTGVLAAVVAAPCTAPFMATAVGVALTQSAPVAYGIFATLGLGLALPYLLLTLVQGLARRVPASGRWMERLREALAFPMYGAAAWLVWVLVKQVGAGGVVVAGGGFVLLALAAWLWELGRGGEGRAWLPRTGAAASLAAALALAALPLETTTPPAPGPVAKRADAEPFSPRRLAALTGAGRTVFLNLTADWCITCKVNERVALSGPRFRALLEGSGVVYMKGDWTRRDPRITALLESFGRAGVPLYVLYRPGRAPTVLPQILTPGILSEHLTFAPASGSAG